MIDNLERFVLPNNEEVLFDSDKHKYYVQGKEVLSVTNIISEYYGDNYGSVNPIILKASADYGTMIHKELQDLIEYRQKDNMDENIWKNILEACHNETHNYFNLVEKIYKIEPILTEKVVVIYNNKQEPVACGRFDLICKVDGKNTLADFKTTSTINKKNVTAQLNLYLLGAYQSGYINNMDMNLGVIQLSGNTARLIPVVKLNENFYSNILKGVM